MNDTRMKRELGDRLTLQLEIEGRIDARYAEKIAELSAQNETSQSKLADCSNQLKERLQEIASLKRQLEEATSAQQTLEQKAAEVKKNLVVANAEIASLAQKHAKFRDEFQAVKKERDELKALNPQALKKNLEEKKKEIIKQSAANQQLQASVKELQKTVRTLKDEASSQPSAAEGQS
jgi:chromosome segregation ATPase